MREPRFSLRQLGYFICVAECGSVAGAAEALHISASAVSDAIRDLERELNAPLLLRRKGHGVALTSIGAALVPRARALLADASDLRSGLHGIGDELSGHLTVGCMSTLAPFLLPRLITEYQRLHPKVALDFVEGSQTEVQQLLYDGRCEVAILYDDGDLASHFTCEKLYDVIPRIVLSATHRLARQRVIRLRDLAGEPMIMTTILPSREFIKAIFRHAGMTPNVRHATSNFELARALVARGGGYSIMVQTPDSEISYEGLPLVARPIAGLDFKMTVVLSQWANVKRGRQLQAFVAICHQMLDAGGPGSPKEVKHSKSVPQIVARKRRAIGPSKRRIA
jgi:DNA-binding transcriptional LysR family regulator